MTKPITEAELVEWQDSTRYYQPTLKAVGADAMYGNPAAMYFAQTHSSYDAERIVEAFAAMPRLIAEVRRLRDYAEHRAFCKVDEYENDRRGRRDYPCTCGLIGSDEAEIERLRTHPVCGGQMAYGNELDRGSCRKCDRPKRGNGGPGWLCDHPVLGEPDHCTECKQPKCECDRRTDKR